MSAVGQTYNRRRAAWTEEEIIAKIKEWVEKHGEPPTANDWHPSDARRQARRSAKRARAWLGRALRFDDGDWPWVGSVSKRFGSWNKAIEAAGFTPRPSYRPIDEDMGSEDDMDQIQQLVKEATKAEGDNRVVALYAVADAALNIAHNLEGAPSGD